ncbi:MAG: hypothetical protein RJA36_2375 [Pseudomonadota bacterium]|jgi:two-component system sensor histidine kinase KdpD
MTLPLRAVAAVRASFPRDQIPLPALSSITYRPALRWACVVLLLAAATAAGLLADPYVSLTSQAMFYVLAVELASYRLGRLEAAACAVGAVAALNFFFVPPRWTFAIDQREHLIALAVMLMVALMTSRLATGLRRETQAARISEGRARQLQELAGRLSGASSEQEVRSLGMAALQAAFGPAVSLALTDAQGRLQEEDAQGLAPEARHGMERCLQEAAAARPEWTPQVSAQTCCLPLGEQGRMFGAVCIRNLGTGQAEALEHARALCSLLAQALWRLSLNASMLAARSEAQRQEMLSTFLAAISHDLRTPLATILGASTSLQTQRERLSAEQRSRMLESIATEARYLGTLTDNTLQLVRLSDPLQELHRDWESAEEVVGAALARVRPQDPDRRIRSEVSAGLPLLRADPVLLGQLLVNLLDNALKYSQADIVLSAELRNDMLELCVADRGEGIAAAEREAIFRPYSRSDRSGQRGAGLGLAVCRAIAQAHGGTLVVEERAGGGSRFCLRLPVEPQQPLEKLP